MRSWFAIDGTLPPVDFHGNADIRFPEALVEAMVDRYSQPGDRVLDPFCGFGTTLGVCSRMGRTPVGFERDAGLYRYAHDAVVPPGRLYHDLAENIAAYALPAFDLLLTSPPFRAFHDATSIESDDYYRELVSVFRHLRPHLKARAPVIVETVNLIGDDGYSVPRAFRSALALTELFAFEREYVCCCDGAGVEVTPGYHHSYLMVFRNTTAEPAP
jgi:DNA modification methylase